MTRCSDAARARGDQLAGTATRMPTWLILEHAGSWGQDAWRDARLPDGLGSEIIRRCEAANVRPLLARRPVPPGGHQPVDAEHRPRAWIARSSVTAPWLATTVLDDPRDLLDLEVSTLATTAPRGWELTDEPFFGVCTHGRHDACCAIRGRPVAAALAAAEPDATWEVSHIGGDRFAANLLVLPEGLYYGGLDPATVVTVAATHRRHGVDLEHLRGRSTWSMPVQAALIALRRHLGDIALTEPSNVRAERTEHGWEITANSGGQRWAIDVTRQAPPAVPLTCSARAPGIPWRHTAREPGGVSRPGRDERA